jgi:hypothetical protein
MVYHGKGVYMNSFFNIISGKLPGNAVEQWTGAAYRQ